MHQGQRLSQRFRGRRYACALAVVLGVVGTTPSLTAAPGPQPDALSRARTLYNARQYDQAIVAAEQAARQPAIVDRARLVLGRSHLERYRQGFSPDDLDAARAALSDVRVAALSVKERLEYVVGLGEALYFDSAFGAAADLFAGALGADTPADTRDAALDWWATSLDRLAQQRAEGDREDLYAAIATRMQAELEKTPPAAAASYWLAAAARGEGDLETAWHAAIAGWVRALLLPDRGAALRADLDTLVETAIIPERARAIATAPADRDRAVQAMKTEWEGVKAAWK